MSETRQPWVMTSPLKGVPPWKQPLSKKNGTAKQWRFAGIFYDWWVAKGSDKSKNRCGAMLTELSIECTLSTARTCIRKFQGGWNPYNDERWLKFSGKHNEARD